MNSWELANIAWVWPEPNLLSNPSLLEAIAPISSRSCVNGENISVRDLLPLALEEKSGSRSRADYSTRMFHSPLYGRGLQNQRPSFWSSSLMIPQIFPQFHKNSFFGIWYNMKLILASLAIALCRFFDTLVTGMPLAALYLPFPN